MRIFMSTVFSGLLAACVTLPDIEQPTPDRTAKVAYEGFVPMDRVVLEQRIGDARAEETEDQLDARIAVLRARAARLRAASIE